MNLNVQLFRLFTCSPLLIGTLYGLFQYFITQPDQIASAKPTKNLEVSTVSYWGGNQDDLGTAIAIAPDKTIVLSGQVIGNNFGQSPVNLLGGGNGVILRTDSPGKLILSVTRIGEIIDDLDIHSNTGKIAVVGDFGLSVLDAKAQNMLWTVELGEGGGATTSNGRRVAVGIDGKIAALFKKQVTVFDENSRQIGQFYVRGRFVEDVAIDSNSNSVIVTGYSQKNKGGCRQLQVSFIRGYDYAGNVKWTNYDWTHGEARSGNSSCADTRGVRIAIGKDGKLYFAGESAGGNTIYRYNPRDLSQEAPNVIFDPYNHPYNTASNHILYYARFDSATGDIEQGQFHLSRRSNGKGNTIVPRAIAADENGNVLIGGWSAAKFANRDESKISGQSGSYAAYDNFVLAVSPDFSSRTYMVSWNKSCTGKNQVVGVAAAYGVRAMISDTAGCDMITVNPLQGNPKGGTEVLYSVWAQQR